MKQPGRTLARSVPSGATFPKRLTRPGYAFRLNWRVRAQRSGARASLWSRCACRFGWNKALVSDRPPAGLTNSGPKGPLPTHSLLVRPS